MLTSDVKGRAVRVVVVDDNVLMRDKVVQLLQPGYEVIGTAADGPAALEIITLLEPEIALMDISMPGISGIEVASKLKEKDSPVKVVFLTVHDDFDFVRAALNVGAFGYVVKSHMATDLTAAMRSVS